MTDEENFQDWIRDMLQPVPSIDEIKSMQPEDLAKPLSCGCTHLFHAVRRGSTTEVVNLLIERTPEALSKTNKKGNIILSSVGDSTLPDVARLVAENTPVEALRKLDSDGDTAFHCMIQNKASDNSLGVVIRRCPFEVFAVTNKKLRTPVHEAVEHGMAVNTFKLLLERSGEKSLETKDISGKLPIQMLTSRTSIELIEFIIERSPASTLANTSEDGQGLLHCALEAGVSLAVLEMLIEKCPSEVISCQDITGQVPLHTIFASRGVPSTAAIKALIRASPACLMCQDNNGQLPLHCALPGRIRLKRDAVLLMIEGAPASLSVTDKEGRLPIHVAFERWRSAEVEKLLLMSCSSKHMAVRDNQGRTPLLVAASRRVIPLDLLRELVEKTPPEALLLTGRDNQNAMHLFAMGESPSGVLKYMKDTLPELLLIPDAFGRRPLHHAIRQNLPLSDIQALVEAYPDSLLSADIEGRVPIHHLSASGSLDVAKFVTNHALGKKSLQIADKSGRLPLHVAIRQALPVETIKHLFESDPDAALCFDNNGNLPLCYMLPGNQTSITTLDWKLDVLKLFVDENPHVLSLRNQDGRLPLHDAVDAGAPIQILELLVDAYPDATKQANCIGQLPLHFAVTRKLPWESFQFLLKSFRGAACVGDKKARIPFFLACQISESLDVAFALLLENPELQILPPTTRDQSHAPSAKKTRTNDTEGTK